jgi:hypothetical protein
VSKISIFPITFPWYNIFMAKENKVTYFAQADYRNKLTPFGIKAEDRTRHVYVIGKTGMGKSTLLENMAVQDLRNGEGMAFIDPHGSTAELLLDYVPEDRIKDVVYFAPFDTDHPVAFNIMEDVGHDKRHLVANGLMSAFKKIWVDAWSARMEYILNNTILALLEYPDATLLGVNRMFTDKDYRKKVVDHITDPSIKSFWVDEYAKYTDRYTQEATPAIQNKVGQFVSNPLIRNIIGQPKSTFNIREMMDQKKILIMNLSKGKVGEQNTNLLGSMLITKIYLAAMSRADASREEMSNLPNFYFFVDEFQSFANESFADILSEARKYHLNLTIAHQYIEQMQEEVRAAVFGNVGTMITFRVGSFDAEVLEKEFLPAFTAEDIVNLDKYQLYLRLMIDGVGSRPFSAVALPPIPHAARSFKEEILKNSREYFGRTRTDVEEEIVKWHQTSFAEPKPERPKTDNGAVTSSNGTVFTPANHSTPGGSTVSVPMRPPMTTSPQQTESRPSVIPQAPVSTGASSYPPRTENRFPTNGNSSSNNRASSGVSHSNGRGNTFERRANPSRNEGGNEPRERREPEQRPAYSQPVRQTAPPRMAPTEQRGREFERPRLNAQNFPERARVDTAQEFTPVASPRPAPVSLNTLRRESSVSGAAPTQNRNTLKEALSGILNEVKKAEKKVEDIAEEMIGGHADAPKEAPRVVPPPQEPPQQTTAESPRPSAPAPQSHAPKEIPEDVLRGMLSVDDEK